MRQGLKNWRKTMFFVFHNKVIHRVAKSFILFSVEYVSEGFPACGRQALDEARGGSIKTCYT
ncbi:hypothetical protein A3H10_05120 [Candidatus Uhrbacteria bacterium RIFCSPLOWO2_12_FULL_46_10]|uniref:Uncharacterized protein n=1 Tax=Candidatus Uhrbacteria bacterium RIFCSPLOWO2_01_FULL_47_25 TaxID=1802402 RepID=A0A1F7UUT1_9BACT|nr:MAG: hypothetical protein A3D60_05430 [Candidatus Uhrbacteria bacterium RIFCSPHIGHO2_02_FULL_47_29]OGL81468.1 MAG: hypothetical protein A2936_00090 [Candidatus Uhrbacteria bacterium RIFCSPLOWO2_01_FULL_47_25]OGL90149.1 MAG: hypothetical protein A3H10_05120 [Candidatus Uhrbacteria bacterium RIFCSPLOWO2_12_FULL_46_10]